KDPQREFGPVRLWGAIGWVVASWPFIFILVDWVLVPEFGSVAFLVWLGPALGTGNNGAALEVGNRSTFRTAGAASVPLGLFSLWLPHTPPKQAAAGAEEFAWLEAMKLLRVPFILVLFIVTFLDAAVHQCYFFWAERYLLRIGIPSNWTMAALSISQVAEIGTM